MRLILASLLSLAAASEAQAQARINLLATAVSADTSAVAGHPLAITATFESVSTTAPGSFRWAAYLTVNGSLTGARLLGRFGPVSLGAAESRVVSASANVPSDVAGRYTVAAFADDNSSIAEYDELDNVVYAAAETVVRPELPDFELAGVRPVQAELRAGEPLTVELRMANLGELDGQAEVAVYLSPDPVISTQDVRLGTTQVSASAGAVGVASLQATVPAGLAVGDWVVGAIVDEANLVTEAVEINNSATSSARLNVYSDSLGIETRSLPGGVVARAYFMLIEVSGGNGHYRFRPVSALPTGLSLDPVTGILSGAPARSGDFPVSLEVSSHGGTAQASLSLHVDESGLALTIANQEIADGSTGLSYEQVLIAAGGEPPYHWAVAEGSQLPPGLDLNTDGVISGVPADIGTFSFRIEVSDEAGAHASVEYTLDISPPVNVLVLVSDVPPLPVGQPVDIALSATGGVPPYRWEAVNHPPPGMTLTEQGHLSGTAARVGSYTLRVRVTDATREHNSDTTLVFIEVSDDGALSVVTTALPEAVLRIRYEVPLEVSGGVAPYTWSLVPGDSLPGGFVLAAADGVTVIRGTAVREAAQPFALRVEDAQGRVAEQLYLLQVQSVDRSGSSGGCACVAGGQGGAWMLVLLLPLLVRRPRR